MHRGEYIGAGVARSTGSHDADLWGRRLARAKNVRRVPPGKPVFFYSSLLLYQHSS